MEIKKCKEEDIVNVGAFYDRVVKHLCENVNYPKWTYKEYPSEGSVREKVEEGSQFMCLEDGEIVGAFVLNDNSQGKYENAKWSEKMKQGEYMVCHALATEPSLQGKGLGKQIVEFCIKYADEEGFLGIRLDVVPDNIPAKKLYEKCGFKYVGDVDLERNIPEIPVFSMYELNFETNKEDSNIGLGISIGISLGVAYGIIFDNLTMGISLGMCFGVAIGSLIKKK